MRIGIAKPDYGITGGFEVVLSRIEHELTARGHDVSWLTVDVPSLGRRPFGVDVPGDVWEACPEFFSYMAIVEPFRQIDAGAVDVVISTQPPSFFVDHPRHLALFYHHRRVFYDLSDVFVAAGFVEREVHAAAQRHVHAIDGAALARVTWFLAASEAVRERLRLFNGLTGNVGVYQAGIGLPAEAAGPGEVFEDPLCVSRHEFPKRTELFVHALKLLGTKGAMVGTGGRLPWVQTVDVALSRRGTDLDGIDEHELWLCRPGAVNPEAAATPSPVRYLEHVPAADLAALYRSALCVVAPAYLEDYGLTAIEGMSFGKPVIVCKDGGGLTEFVEDGVTGFVVEPTGRAIADAIRILTDDPGLARRLGRNAFEASRQYTWERATEQLLAGLAEITG